MQNICIGKYFNEKFFPDKLLINEKKIEILKNETYISFKN